MTPRILHIIGSLDRGGTAKQLTMLAAGLPRGEFDVHVLALNSLGVAADELRRSGIETISIGKRWRIDPLAYWRLRRQIRRLRPDLVHTWRFDANTYGRAAALSAGVRHLVSAERGVDRQKMDREFRGDHRFAKRTDRIVANSNAVRDFYVARGLPAEKITVIPNGVQQLEPSPIARGQLLVELGLPPDAKLIAYLGPLTVNKRLKELIWATDQLRAVAANAHLLILGDGSLRRPLERYRRLNHVDQQVHFLGWRDDVNRFLPHVDVLWQAGSDEGQSNAILEAMAAGLPVVAAEVPANRELVIEGETGYLVPLDQRAGFARCTLPLLENQELARRLGLAGRARVLEFSRPDTMVARYASLYREVLGG